jgi:DNA-binding NtrC family response regulator
LVLREVAALDEEQQQWLLEWLDDNAERLQVVTATETTLFAEVEGGRFNAGLYYRLNTVLEEVVGA